MRVSDAITVPPAVERLRWLALAAAALLTAHGEFELATCIGVTPWLAWLLPVGLDVYAYCAFAARARADVRAALALMIGCQALAHLLATGILPTHWLLIIAVSAVAPIICWRVHHLGEHATDHTAPVPSITQVANITPATVALVSAALVPPADEPAATAATSTEATTRPVRRPAAETRKLAAEITAAEPGITRESLAARLGITPRRLRAVLNAA